MFSSILKQLVNISLFFGFWLLYPHLWSTYYFLTTPPHDNNNNTETTTNVDVVIHKYGFVATIILCCLKLANLISLPVNLFTMFGSIFFNDEALKTRKPTATLHQKLCFRIVTRGDYPRLVKTNVHELERLLRNLEINNYIIEVVANKAIHIETSEKVREIVVPDNYRTKNGTKYKARSLHYALEDHVNVLNDEDWVVHLDEESQLTRRAVIGILDFALRNKHSIGQGLIVHGKGEPKPLNVLSTLADTYRVAGYVGSSRFCLSALHRPLNIFNGSFVVCQKQTEQMVSFDHGMESSITEDAYFAMRASNLGLTFDWIEGELLEKSAFTFWDFVRQRKRWIQGLSLVHNSTRFVPDLSCICFKFNYYVWITSPIQLVAFYALWLWPVSFAECWPSVEWMCWVNGVSVSYLFLLGMTYSFDMDKLSWWEKVCYVGGLWLAFRYWMWAEAIAILWAFLGSKDEFYVIKK